MRLLADLHISPSTVRFLRDLGHDVVRADAILPNTATDEEIVAAARADDRSILTQASISLRSSPCPERARPRSSRSGWLLQECRTSTTCWRGPFLRSRKT